MPRTEHLSNIQSNHIYSLNAQLKYAHHGPNMTTAIIEDESIQSRIKIPNSLNNIREELEEGVNYHFGYCYISPNGWIKARNPDDTIKPLEQNSQAVMTPLLLSQIGNNSEQFNGRYITTVLFVINTNQAQQITKNGKNLTICVLNCYANGFLVDVTIWNSDLPISQLKGKWLVFSGFRLKKLVDWKFVLVSSVYSKILPYEGDTKSMPYNQFNKYLNLSSVYENRSLSDLLKVEGQHITYYSNIESLVKKVATYSYEGCSVCKKKVVNGVNCNCRENSGIKLFSIQKLNLQNEEGKQIEAAVFDEEIQKQVLSLVEPKVVKVNIKSTSKKIGEEMIQSHIVTKIIF